jgi:hypothetical protein
MNNDFARNLIKGKIGEAIFDQMFREQGNFTVIPFGYDRIIPEVAQYARKAKYKKVIDNIRSAPDFALVSHNKEQVFLVEVKYRTDLNQSMDNLIKIASKIQDKWQLVWMFVCTPEGFYFDRTSEIINNERLTPMGEQWICKELQEKYLKLLRDFIKTSGSSNIN